MLETILHEAGHIILNHDMSLKRDSVIELESNSFAQYVLNKLDNKLKLTKKKKIIIVSIILLLIAVSTAIYLVTNLDTVYVTASGTRYHKKDCRYVNSSSTPVDIDIAKEDYVPCKICY